MADGRAVARNGDDVSAGERTGTDDDLVWCGHALPLDVMVNSGSVAVEPVRDTAS